MRALAIGLLTGSMTLAQSVSQRPPVFRAGVDLVTVDVAVVDRNGAPVTGLVSGDFSIVAGRHPRRVVSADYVSVAARRPSTSGGDATLPAPTTNSRPSIGRTFLFVVDVEHLREGGGHAVLKSIAEYLDRLSPDDRVGLVSVPYNMPRVDLTTNRQLVKDAAALVVGASTRDEDDMMTVGEAAAIEQLDPNALYEYLDRIRKGCGDPPPGFLSDPALPCTLRWQPLAVKVMDGERRQTRNLFDTLRALAAAMAVIDGPKSLVLVSQGVVNDRNTIDDLRQFASAAEKARVTLYAINVDAPLADVTSQFNMTGAHVRDHQVLLDGMATLAIAGRGDAFVVSGTPTSALARIDMEMSGYYLLSFEREPGDRDSEHTRIDVAVNWPGATVRARKEFTSDKPAPPRRSVGATDLKAALGEMLRWPVPVTDLGVDVDAYTAPALTGESDVRTIVAASLASGGRSIAAVGYEVTDAKGKVIADGIEPAATAGSSRAATVETRRLLGDRQLYLTTLALPLGRYRLKFAAIDGDGRRGSLEHAFEVGTGRAGAVRMSDVFVGEISPAGFVPNPWRLPGMSAVPVSVELVGDTPAAFANADVTLELGRAGGSPFATSQLSLRDTTEPRRRLASATLAVASLPAGDYLVSAVFRAADGGSIRRSRLFTKR